MLVVPDIRAVQGTTAAGIRPGRARTAAPLEAVEASILRPQTGWAPYRRKLGCDDIQQVIGKGAIVEVSWKRRVSARGAKLSEQLGDG